MDEQTNNTYKFGFGKFYAEGTIRDQASDKRFHQTVRLWLLTVSVAIVALAMNERKELSLPHG